MHINFKLYKYTCDAICNAKGRMEGYEPHLIIRSPVEDCIITLISGYLNYLTLSSRLAHDQVLQYTLHTLLEARSIYAHASVQFSEDQSTCV